MSSHKIKYINITLTICLYIICIFAIIVKWWSDEWQFILVLNQLLNAEVLNCHLILVIHQLLNDEVLNNQLILVTNQLLKSFYQDQKHCSI